MKQIKKKTIFLALVILLATVLLVFGVLYYKKQKDEKDTILSIQNHYSSSVVMSHGNIYEKRDDHYEEVGRVENTVHFRLNDFQIDDVNDKYFPILDSNYYIYYEDAEKAEEQEATVFPDYYVSKEEATTKEVTNFYQEGAFVFSLNTSLSFDVIYLHDDFVVVSFLGQIYDLKKEEVELVSKDIEEVAAIPVIEVPEVKDDCSNDKCIKPDKLKGYLKTISEKNLYTVSKTDYELWASGNVHFKKGALYFVSSKIDTLTSIFEEQGFVINELGNFKLRGRNEPSKTPTSLEAISNYYLSENTIEDHFNKMIHGETIVIPVPSAVASGPKTLPPLDAKATNIAVLNYHFFYANGESCGQGICLEVNKFREQLEYLKNNQYKTLTMEEYRAWMYGEIELPARSVLLTIDDGAMGTGKHNGNKLIPLLEEYDMHATLFLISGWWAKDNYISKNLDIESHTYDMHTEGLCSNQPRGAKLLCSTKEQALEDLKKSIQMVGSSTAFCFPFYAYNDSAIQSVKDAGFKLAFIGGNRKSNRSNDKYKIPRYPIYDTTTLNQFINMIA